MLITVLFKRYIYKKRFSDYFCLIMGGSGSGAGTGSIPLTNGYRSGIRESQKITTPDQELVPGLKKVVMSINKHFKSLTLLYLGKF